MPEQKFGLGHKKKCSGSHVCAGNAGQTVRGTWASGVGRACGLRLALRGRVGLHTSLARVWPGQSQYIYIYPIYCN